MTTATLDKDALKKKYAEERDKRLRSDGNAQYQRLEGKFEDLAADPYTPVKERAPVTDHVTFAFIGGGFAGLVVGARLKQSPRGKAAGTPEGSGTRQPGHLSLGAVLRATSPQTEHSTTSAAWPISRKTREQRTRFSPGARQLSPACRSPDEHVKGHGRYPGDQRVTCAGVRLAQGQGAFIDPPSQRLETVPVAGFYSLAARR